MDKAFVLLTITKTFLICCFTIREIYGNSDIELLERKKPVDGRRPFEGHKVVRAYPSTKSHTDLIGSLEYNPDIEVDFWSRTRNIDIHVGPEDYVKLDALLKQHNIAFTILNNNLQRSLDEDEKAHYRTSRDWHGEYHTYQQIHQKIHNLANKYKNWASLIKTGKSYEGNDILGLEITGDNKIPTKQKGVLICGQHAREWIAPAVCLYMMDKLLMNYTKDPKIKAMVDRYSWVIFPSVNPDGYLFTWTEGERLWRKNRQRNENSTCHGTDLNRNWDFKWAGHGASGDPCSDIYYGSSPFSAPETKAIADYVKANRENIFTFIDIHSYSQLWMYPWSYTRQTRVKDDEELDRVSRMAVNALQKTHQTDFKAGPAGIIIYEAAGSGKDWSYGAMGVKYAFAIELRDKGHSGFLLPPEQIIPTGEETLAALQTLSVAMNDYADKSTSYYKAKDGVQYTGL